MLSYRNLLLTVEKYEAKSVLLQGEKQISVDYKGMKYSAQEYPTEDKVVLFLERLLFSQ